MSAVSKLVRWLPKAVEATADDIARFGPNAGRVRQLLDFLPTMSDEAARAVSKAIRAAADDVKNAELKLPMNTSGAERPAWKAAEWASRIPGMGASRGAARMSAIAETYSDILDPQTYLTITNPLNAGRAIDLLRTRPRYQGTPFLDVVQNLAERGAVTGPRDVVRAGRIARAPEDVREIALTLIADGMSPADALRAARML